MISEAAVLDLIRKSEPDMAGRLLAALIELEREAGVAAGLAEWSMRHELDDGIGRLAGRLRPIKNETSNAG